MSMKRPLHFFLAVLLLCTARTSAQTNFAVQSSTTFTIRAGTPFFVDGLIMQPTSHFTLNAPNQLAHNTTITNTIAGTYINRVYKWNNTLPAFWGTITMDYLDAELNSIPEADLTLNVHDGTAWASYAAGVTRDGINNRVITSGLSNVTVQELTLASVFVPLPVQWGPIKAYRKGNLAYIEWSTSHESNISHYAIQKSTTGVSWQQAGELVPASNTSHQVYIQPDSGISNAKTLYRIQQVSSDNHIGWSPVVTVEALNSRFAVLIFPNPASNRLVVRSESPVSIQSISIYTTEGKLLLTRKIHTPEYNLDIARWLPGTYLLQVTGADGRVTHTPFIKK
jgi:hypothetical protein